MPATRLSQRSTVALTEALKTPGVISRYRAKVRTDTSCGCWWWTGAVSGNGHGRFWISGNGHTEKSITVIAHRFGYGLVHGIDALLAVELLTHRCDNPLCQNSDHLDATTNAQNRAEWAARRHTPGSRLRDTDGARGRARRVRDGLKAGQPVSALESVGVRRLDRDQLALWEV